MPLPDCVSRHRNAPDWPWTLRLSATPIVPILVGDAPRTFLFWRALFDHGVFVNAVLPPAVPEGAARIRTSVMASHNEALIDEALDRIGQAGRQIGLI